MTDGVLLEDVDDSALVWPSRRTFGLDKRRTFVLCRHSLVAEAVKTLLENQEGIDLVGIETDEGRARESIKTLKPDTVVVEAGNDGVPVDSLLSYLVRECPESRMVGVRQEQNEIDIFYGHQRRVTKAEDLLEAILES